MKINSDLNLTDSTPGQTLPLSDEFTALSKRISRLEKTGRRWMIATLVIGSMLLAVVTLGAVEAKTSKTAGPVVCSGLQVVDQYGRMRISIGQSDGAPGMSIYDEYGYQRVAVGMRPDGRGGLGVFDDRGRGRLTCGSWPGGASGFEIMDENGRDRARLRTYTDGEGRLEFFDEDGRVLFIAP